MDKTSHDEMKEHAGIEAGLGGVEDERAMKKAVLKMDVRYVLNSLEIAIRLLFCNVMLTMFSM